MSNLINHATSELKAAGMDPDGPPDDMNTAMANDIIELMRVFAEQGHSGGSAPYCIKLFSTLANFEPWGPITGADSEWGDSFDDKGTRQNRRCCHVFQSADGSAYDIEGRIFRDPDGCCVTNRDSRTPVTFPYTPNRIYIDRDDGGGWVDPTTGERRQS